MPSLVKRCRFGGFPITGIGSGFQAQALGLAPNAGGVPMLTGML